MTGSLRRHVGEYELIVMSDGRLQTPADLMTGGMPTEVSEGYLRPDDHGDIWLGLNCVVVRSSRHIILVDTGFGDGPLGNDPDLDRDSAGLTDALRAEGIDPADVNVVVNTHLHTDHSGGNLAWDTGEGRPAFVNAEYVVQQSERDWALSGDPATAALYAPDDVQRLAASGQLRMHEGDRPITSGLTVRKTPGHTPGHQILLVESRDQTAAITGDLAPMTLHVRHPEWELRGDHEPTRAVTSRRELVRWAEARRATVVPYHEPGDAWVQLGDAR